MRSVHVSTVGKSPEPIVNGFRHHSVDHQVLLHSATTLDVAREVKLRIEDLAGQPICELVEIDPFDLRDIIAKIVTVRRRFGDCDIYVNITGGTNVMASAALVACFAIGGHAYYLKESPGRTKQSLAETVIILPVPKVRLDSLDESQCAILKHIRKHGGRLQKANVALQQALGGASPQRVSYHLKKLREKGLIELGVEGREKIAALTPAGLLFAEII